MFPFLATKLAINIHIAAVQLCSANFCNDGLFHSYMTIPTLVCTYPSLRVSRPFFFVVPLPGNARLHLSGIRAR